MIQNYTDLSPSFAEQVTSHCQTSAKKFKSITRYYSLFHITFFILAALEIFLFFFFFSFFAQSALLALSIGAIFFTGFSYFVLLFYFQGKKPEQLLTLKTSYLSSCKECLEYAPSSPDYHRSLAHSLYQLANTLSHLEYHYYPFPKQLPSLRTLLEKLSVWSYWKEVHAMKESLLLSAIDSHIQLVKSHPTDLEAHASLAEAHILLAKLYQAPEDRWVLPIYSSQSMRMKYKQAMNHALEEYKIICHFSPDNAWVHSQLASTYHELEDPHHEMREYEKLLALIPNDTTLLLRLGTLYFQQGATALGLQIYQQLQPIDSRRAEELISFYDSYTLSK